MKQTITYISFFVLSLNLFLFCSSLENNDSSINHESMEKSSQEKDNNSPNPINPNFIVKTEGWKIPETTKCQNAKRVNNNNSKLGMNTYTICDIPTETGDFGEMRVRAIYEFHSKERKFCYRIEIGFPFPKQIKDKDVSMSAAIIYENYYDFDGDGRFETKEKNAGLGSPQIPQWVQN